MSKLKTDWGTGNMKEQRNRASGWQHAKISGHENEKLLFELVNSNKHIKENILRIAHRDGAGIANMDFGGLRETNITSVLGGTTKSKADMRIFLSNGDQINISIKKSAGGQVYLIGVDRFVDGFEKQYAKIIPVDVKRAISLYWGAAEDTHEIINNFSQKYKNYELRKNRLVATTLAAYDSKLSTKLIQWFNDNIMDIFDFCFSRGLAKNQKDWAEILWYKNKLHEQENSFDSLLNIKEMKTCITKTAVFGSRNGGSTILLPFGFVQWHQAKMQFHHSYEKLMGIMR